MSEDGAVEAAHSETRECACTTKVVVVERKPKRRVRPFKAVGSLLSLVPGFRIVRGLIILGLVWYGLRIFTPDYDVPWVLGASCVEAEPKPDGLAGAAYEIGSALHVAEVTQPSIGEIQSTLSDVAFKTGQVWKSLETGFNGQAAPDVAFKDADEREAAYLAAAACGQCETAGGDTRSVSVSDGIATAVTAAEQVGFSGDALVKAVAIAGAESHWKSVKSPMNSNGTYDHGFWQINSVHADLLATHDWRDPLQNAEMAWEVSGHGTDFTPWTTYNSGSYLTYVDDAQAAIAAGSQTVNVAASTLSAEGVKMDGLQPVAQRAADFVRKTWGVTDIGGFATSGHMEGSKHYVGLAIDVMTYGDKALGREIMDYFSGPGYKPFGVDNVIFNRMIYNSGRGLHDYGDHGSPTANHEDHVHVDFFADGGGGTVPAADTGVAVDETCSSPVVSAGSMGELGAGEARVATYNVLGASHDPRPGLPRWPDRIVNVARTLEQTDVSLVALQELQRPQYAALKKLTDGWEFWHPDGKRTDNTIGWRTDTWSLARTSSVRVPYFFADVPMPLVQLQHSSGARLWVLGVHNPANTHGDASRKRQVALQREIAALHEVGGSAILMGDMNDHEAFYCPATAANLVSAAPGGSVSPCRPPDGKTVSIDWITGTSDLHFSGWARVDDRDASDHAMSVADLSWGPGLRAG